MTGTSSPHGTRARYVNHLCRCRPCVEANTSYQNELTERLATRPPERIPHGVNGFRNYRCRCGVCQEANSRACREYREGKAARSATSPEEVTA